MTRVAILWHMHQPFYQDLVTGEHLLPWVRLHALKDYYGMAALTREFPDVRITFNLVPSLLVQLQAFAENRATDRDLELTLKPADALDAADVDFMLENFFHAQRQRMVDVHPRYGELLAQRGGSTRKPGSYRGAAAGFSESDLRDLQVWHKLAWIDPFYLDADERVRGLVAKGRGFTEADKETLRAVELEILNKVIPEYRAAAARGHVELSTSPFFHPILPLLCDSDIYLRTHPDARRPRVPFRHPEDAAEQLARAVRFHHDAFGIAPTGVWPSEGSVSDAVVPIVAAAGLRWMATDELILARTLGIAFARDGSGRVDQPERLYRPYQIRVDDATVACVFRDHDLSDLIGFTYQGWTAAAAADDFVRRLVEAGRGYAQRGDRGEPVIAVILDGENAWEHFEGGGRPFLRALYGRLTAHPELRTVTMAEACDGATEELGSIFPGSWIDANFSIWIGHADDQRAWSQLADARAVLDAAVDVDAVATAAAREEVFIAEGSDWFWWYGDDHSSAQDLQFDDLFRRHLRNAYRFLGQPVPDELYARNRSTDRPIQVQSEPTGLLAPTLDGEETSYFEWLPAGSFEVPILAGAMHRTDGGAPALRQVRFGFSADTLFVRIDGQTPMVDLLAEGRELSLTFLAPTRLRFTVRQAFGRPTGGFAVRHGSENGWSDVGPRHAAVALGTILELGLPLSSLGVSAGAEVAFFVAVGRGELESERHPSDGPIRATAPDAAFSARHWSA
jgi:alpha-amylase/alpha-mannosidase (GH57 family)